MNRKKGIAGIFGVTVMLVLLLTGGCGKETESVKWVVPDMVTIHEETIEKINRMLSKDGKQFRLEVEQLDFMDYNNALKTAEFDIAFAGFSNGGDEAYTVLSAIKEGQFYRLDEFLKESEIYEEIPEILWESVTYNGGIYSVPGGGFAEGTSSVLVRKEIMTGSASEDFGATLEEIEELLSEEHPFLYDYASGLHFLEYCGLDYRDGLLWEADGTYHNPLETEECELWLKTLNRWYREGKLTTDRTKDWAVCITRLPGDFYETETVVYEAPKVYTILRFPGSIAISADSEQKEAAWEMLQLFYLDAKYGNCLVFGADYEEKDGYAVNKSGEVLTSCLNKLSWGIGVGLLKGSDEALWFATSEERKEYYRSKVVLSGAAGRTLPEVSGKMKELEEDYKKIITAENFAEMFEAWKEEASPLFE